MKQEHVARIAQELEIKTHQVEATASLFAEEATVPFIARYRKEATGNLDEVAITDIRDRLLQLEELDKRREAILKSIEEQGKLTDDLKAEIEAADTMSALEDLYLPYRPKRRIRATVAREKGLEPLAQQIFEQSDLDPAAEAGQFIDAEKGVESAEQALEGARDIIAEWINEDQNARARMREFYRANASFRTKVVEEKKQEAAKFKDYFEWDEPAAKTPSHRVLAMRRGESEGCLSLRVTPPEEPAVELLRKMFVKAENAAGALVGDAAEDCYKRLLGPSMETEIRLETKKVADEEAIRVFAQNLRQLLLAPPLGQKRVMAIDPGQRTGCKLVCLDRQGKLLHNDTIFPHPPQKQAEQAAATVLDLLKKFEIEAVAIGNGTAGRETEAFVRALDLPDGVFVVLVNESGASVYSASKAARDEFPHHDLTVRGAVSIGRRLMDPLAELVKIDPKAIGVGQYQHDVDQAALKRSLDDVVMSCVNAVGVEVNTSSKELLTYVSGLGPMLAKNIVEHRNQNDAFSSREDLLNVPRLGPKAFEQAAGFLRIRDGANPLDASAVHPESYPVVDQMAADLGCSVQDLMKDDALRQKIDLQKYVTDKVGLPTLNDILSELAKPGRDPRDEFEVFKFQEGVEKMGDLEPGMKLPGIVTNVTNFGAFVDIGVHQDGLIHVSELADRFVKEPSEVVKLHQKVTVRVLSVDLDRQRIALSMKDPRAKKPARKAAKHPRASKSQKKAAAVAKAETKPTPRKGYNNPFADFFEKQGR